MPTTSDSAASLLLELPRTALVGVDQAGTITLTAQVEPLLGYGDEELLGQPIDEFLAHAPAILPRTETACDSERPAMIEAPCRRKDGTSFIAELSMSCVHSTMGAQVWIAMREAPAWHQAVLTRKMFKFIAESSNDAIISSTTDGVVTYWNPAAERLYGYRADEMLGHPVSTLYTGDREAEFAELGLHMLHDSPVKLKRVQRVRKDGTIITVSLTVTPIVDDSGTMIGAAAIARDTGPDDRARARFEALLEAATVAIIGVNSNGRILLVNAAAERAFGYERDQLVGQPVEVLVPGAHQQAHVRLRTGYMANPKTRPMGEGTPLTARRRDGSEFPAEVSLSAIETDDGLLVAAAVRDMTQQVQRERLELQLQQAQRLETLGLLAGGVAHDFNNLMGVIGGYAAFIKDEARIGGDGDAALACATILGDVDSIEQAVARATALTRQLLSFGRREVSRPQLIDLNAAVRDSTRLLDRTLGDHITVITRLAEDVSPIMCDPSQVEQILINAAVNARDAMPDGGSVTIETANVVVDETYAAHTGAPPGVYVRLRIADTGCGMSKEAAAHAFEPFFTTKPAGEGTGLGLSTIYGIVVRHHGHVAIYSELGHGTTLSILQPACQDQSSPETIPTTPDTPPTGADRGAATILVVDDEADLRRVTQRILTRHGHHVLVAADGTEAVAVAEQYQGHIDLLLTDVIMPKMLGNALAEALRAARPGIQVVFMSGYAQPVLADQGTLPPDTTLLEKPFTESSLRSVIAAALRSSAS